MVDPCEGSVWQIHVSDLSGVYPCEGSADPCEGSVGQIQMIDQCGRSR